ncbi:MAG: nucleotidyl transferase AbiEii/AbiGii toxin family protein [Endomicrobia bacterium]|nr:nucleotidyl transferase AbiEii/AbiGii toxin family protein [Endomicrobiia bacterium]
MYNQLQLREIFHIEFLRWFTRKLKPHYYVLKGGVNLRFFYKSIRYSEDMDLDVQNISVFKLKDIVMDILTSKSFQETLVSYGIQKVVPPNISKAKQTETTQRFKIHLLTVTKEDLFTKIEFSRRGIKEGVVVEALPDSIIRVYKTLPVIVAHYDIYSTIKQKIDALLSRNTLQTRDIFDLFILSSQFSKKESVNFNFANRLKKLSDVIIEVSFEQFRDTILNYLPDEERQFYNSAKIWDEIKLKVINFLEEISQYEK